MPLQELSLGETHGVARGALLTFAGHQDGATGAEAVEARADLALAHQEWEVVTADAVLLDSEPLEELEASLAPDPELVEDSVLEEGELELLEASVAPDEDSVAFGLLFEVAPEAGGSAAVAFAAAAFVAVLLAAAVLADSRAVAVVLLVDDVVVDGLESLESAGSCPEASCA
ncbi:MAG: hypothetical protein M3Z95_06570 [Actinomycetota bacterium]|nr:hypothetical protein [Actinomycetota bacterium]